MDSVELDKAVSVPLPSSPGPETQDTPNLLAQATALANGSETLSAHVADTDEVQESPALPAEVNDDKATVEATAEGAAQADVDGAGDDGARPRLTGNNPGDPSERLADAFTPTSKHSEPSSIPPTAVPRHPISRTDSERSIATQPSVTSPRGIPAPLPLRAMEKHANGRISMSSPSPSLVPPGSPGHRRSMTVGKGSAVSTVLISSALETIAASKEAKKSPPLKDAVQHALEMVRAGEGGDRPREIFEPLRLACETRNEKLMVASLDCISKLISYSFFAESPSQPFSRMTSPPTPRATSPPPGGPSQENIADLSLVDIVVHTVTSCHSEATPDSVSLQIVKALLSLALSSTILVHHSSLLKAVRTVYNVFLLSSDPVTQTVAQGGLTQMVHHVFTRCRINDDNTSEGASGDSVSPSKAPSPFPSRTVSLPAQTATSPPHPREAPPSRKPSLHGLPGRGSTDSVSQTTTASHDLESTETTVNGDVPPLRSNDYDGETQSVVETWYPDQRDRDLDTNDLFIKDAFLVFRALCKLTMKSLNTESERDLKSHAMRSKLLSLHLVLTVLNSHMPLIVSSSAIVQSTSSNEPTTLVQAINSYLCLALSRNAVSAVPQVFEICVEIFWRVLSGMRTKLKKEIEVLLHEIFIPILEMKTSTLKQKGIVLGMFARLCQQPQALVEIYLNYDCDHSAVDNIYEHLANVISKLASSPVSSIPGKGNDVVAEAAVNKTTRNANASVPPSYSTTAMAVSGSLDTSNLGLSERQLKRQGLECLIAILKSLVLWGTSPDKQSTDGQPDWAVHSLPGDESKSELAPEPSYDRLSLSLPREPTRQQTPTELKDDPMRFEYAKREKTILSEGIKKFNTKPKKGIEYFLEAGFIPSDSPKDIAAFILITDGLSKSVVGEYLGEGDEKNIAIMHAFVDLLDFRNLNFVEALRMFLQSFRLPGEAQKIDRYMLKFAERYIAGNPQTPFVNADTAYVLAYSTVMLNTDAYNPVVKNRMTKVDFTKNNRGINDGADLPEEMLSQIYDDIQANEIRMKDEVEAQLMNATAVPAAGLAGAFVNVGRDFQREAYMMQSHGMTNKTEALFKTLVRSQRRGSRTEEFFSASHFVHVKPMFEVAWTPFLAGLSGPLQDTDDVEVVELCLEGFKNAIHIVCFFDLELERNAFVTTLAKFTFLNNLGEMKTKNMEAIKALLDVAVTEGNNLKGSWHEVLTCVSKLEHMQLISSGVDIPDAKKGRSRRPAEDLANESRSTHITVAADMVFSFSHHLSGTAIVDFVQALCDVSWEEISSSGLSQHPRMFSLQKLVEISYYNMNRIRIEWSNIWDILGEHFNQVCCHNNPHVGFFALDALRQLSMRFLEKEELPHFKFQKDFLKPFEYTMLHNDNPDIRDMVLQCLLQMVQARVQNMRSGWRTMFGVFSAASKVLTERIVSSSFEIVTRLNKEHFASIVRHGSFADLTVCVTDFCKASKFQKISLLAIAMLRGIIPVMLRTPECGLTPEAKQQGHVVEDAMIKFWFPTLFSFYDIIMNGEDLEVRRLALDSLFSTLKTYGGTFPVDFWDTVCQELLFPIFAVLKSSQDLSRFSTQEDMSVWLSTTMIQALRDLIDLYTFFFDTLERFLDGLLDLLCVCICQENDTLARIGTSCLQQLLENNVKKLSPAKWERIVTTFVRLFRTTTPHQLFDDNLRGEVDPSSTDPNESQDTDEQTILPAPLGSPNGDRPKTEGKMSQGDRRRIFKQIIVKCVLQLLLIETTNDLLRNEEVYSTIPPEHMLRLMGVLDHSYQFARMFNEDKELRTGLWKVGFMKHLPNLLKQESSSAATLVHILCRMYYDRRPEHQAARPQIADRLLPLGLGVLQDFNNLRLDTQAKNIAAWTPVVAEILHGFCQFDDRAFSRYLPAIYPLVVELLGRDVSPEIRVGLKDYLVRVGRAQNITVA